MSKNFYERFCSRFLLIYKASSLLQENPHVLIKNQVSGSFGIA